MVPEARSLVVPKGGQQVAHTGEEDCAEGVRNGVMDGEVWVRTMVAVVF